jgi:hypothetical protein
MGLLYRIFPLVLTSISVIWPIVSNLYIRHICCSLLPYFHIGFNLFIVIIAYRASTSARGATDFVYICTDGEKPETKQKRLEAKYAALQIVPSIEKIGTPKVRCRV